VRIRAAATGAGHTLLTPPGGFAGRLRLRRVALNDNSSPDLVVRTVVNGRRGQEVFDAVLLAPPPPGLA
jgi:hypothetical protein